MPEIQIPEQEKKWHWLFEAALLLRGFNGLIEIISGIFIIRTDKEVFNKLFFRVTHGESIEDPRDRLLIFLNNYLQHLSTNTKIFAAIYILVHGLLNIFLSIQLYREKIWAYQTTLLVMVLFVIYQVYRISVRHSVLLTILTLIDCLFIALLWHEYNYKLKTATLK